MLYCSSRIKQHSAVNSLYLNESLTPVARFTRHPGSSTVKHTVTFPVSRCTEALQHWIFSLFIRRLNAPNPSLFDIFTQNNIEPENVSHKTLKYYI